MGLDNDYEAELECIRAVIRPRGYFVQWFETRTEVPTRGWDVAVLKKFEHDNSARNPCVLVRTYPNRGQREAGLIASLDEITRFETDTVPVAEGPLRTSEIVRAVFKRAEDLDALDRWYVRYEMSSVLVVHGTGADEDEATPMAHELQAVLDRYGFEPEKPLHVRRKR